MNYRKQDAIEVIKSDVSAEEDFRDLRIITKSFWSSDVDKVYLIDKKRRVEPLLFEVEPGKYLDREALYKAIEEHLEPNDYEIRERFRNSLVKEMNFLLKEMRSHPDYPHKAKT